MKLRQICIVFSVFIALCITSYGQDKSIFNPELLDLGDGKIISSTLNESGDFVIQEFKVAVEKAGKYYLAAWINGALAANGEKLEYSILLNDATREIKIRAKKSHPHPVDLGEQMIDLRSGENSIAFKTRKPFCPNVEFIKVSQDEQSRQISSEKYDQYIDEISNHKKSATAPSSSSALKYTLPDSSVNYDFEEGVYFRYTYFTLVTLSSGNTYTFETKNATNDPVIHLFHRSDLSMSWTDDNSGTGVYDAKLTVSIYPWNAGIYYLLIRKNGATNGTCNLHKGTSINPPLYASNCAVSGSRIQCDNDDNETLNWFTADLTGDSHIWLEDQTGSPGEIIAYNDDWTVSSDFIWGNNSRIRKNTTTDVEALIVSSHSSYNPYDGNCDLYMNCKNSTRAGVFKHLKQNDAIMSAPADGSYNCFGWSGGRMVNDYPYSPNSPWYDPDGVEASFDNYYANRDQYGAPTPRYSGGAMNFIKTTIAGSASIGLWGEDVENMDHASVKKPANDHPHGYDWESKDGPFERFFHPKDALNKSIYGDSILVYYRWDTSNPYTDPPSKKSTASLEIEELTREKQVLMKNMVQIYPDQTKFEEIYESWKNTWDDPELIHHSNPKMFAKSKQYTTLLTYCKNEGKEVWPLVFDKYIDGEELNMLLIGDLTYKDYLWVMDDVKQQQRENVKSMNIIPSQRANCINYIVALLGELEREQQSKTHSDVITFEDDQSINVYPNPVKNNLNIEVVGLQESEVIISICDLTGKTLKSVSKIVFGDFTHSINMEDIPDGTYLCKIEIGNLIHTTQINVIK